MNMPPLRRTDRSRSAARSVACIAALLAFAGCGGGGSGDGAIPPFDSAAGVLVHDLDGDGRPDVVMPYQGGVLILRKDPARPGALLRGTALP